MFLLNIHVKKQKQKQTNNNNNKKKKQEYAKYIKDNAVVVLQNYEKEFKIPKEFADKIKKVWETENAIQLAYARRNEFNLSKFFFNIFSIYIYIYIFFFFENNKNN